MDNNKYNEQRYNRKKQWYRFTLGFQQLLNYPIINLIWILFIVGMIFLAIAEKELVSNLDVYPMFASILYGGMNTISILFFVICAIGIIQLIGLVTAIRDEADISIVFGEKGEIKKHPPILIYKKKDRKNGVTKREFYTTIPMEHWKENTDAICDVMDIHIIGDITYGGRKKNKGNHIYFESAKGRKPKERGALYDDTF